LGRGRPRRVAAALLVGHLTDLQRPGLDLLADHGELLSPFLLGPLPRRLHGVTESTDCGGWRSISSISPTSVGGSSAARLRASFRACFSRRRSLSLLSRASFANVVFFLPREAMPVSPSVVEFHADLV